MNSVPTLGVILAGGLGRRMGGGDKPLKQIRGRSLLDRVVETLRPQCDGLILNANGDAARFAASGLPVIPDSIEDYAGPLAGILAGLDWAALHRPDVAWIVSAASDCPFLPGDLVQRLQAARHEQSAKIVIARSGGQVQPVIGLWPVALRGDLRHALVVENYRKVQSWVDRHQVAVVDWPVDPVDPFFNANRPEDLAYAEALAMRFGL